MSNELLKKLQNSQTKIKKKLKNKLNPNSAYVVNVCGPKVQKLRKAFPALLKEEYK